MSFTRIAAGGCAALFAAAPALAQQARDYPTWGPGHMWGMWGGWYPGMIFGPFFMLLMVVATVAVIIWLFRGFGHAGRRHGWCPHCGHHGSSATDILEERFAKGEIDKSEFEEKRKLLGR